VGENVPIGHFASTVVNVSAEVADINLWTATVPYVVAGTGDDTEGAIDGEYQRYTTPVPPSPPALLLLALVELPPSPVLAAPSAPLPVPVAATPPVPTVTNVVPIATCIPRPPTPPVVQPSVPPV
jgi:hypothetical protein